MAEQGAQQIIGEFREARYPWRLRRCHDVIYTTQDARLRDGWLLLPHSAGDIGESDLRERVTALGRDPAVDGVAQFLSAKPIPRRRVPPAGSGARAAGSTVAYRVGPVARAMLLERSPSFVSVRECVTGPCRAHGALAVDRPP